MVVEAKAVLIIGGKLAIPLRKEENVARFAYDGPCDIPRRSRGVIMHSHIASRYIFLMQASCTWWPLFRESADAVKPFCTHPRSMRFTSELAPPN